MVLRRQHEALIYGFCLRRYIFLIQAKKATASNSPKYYSTKEQQSYPKSTFNLPYKYGVPHTTSNIPRIKFDANQNETAKEKVFREQKQDLMSWHHTFWLQENEKFNKEKKEYLQTRKHMNATISNSNGKEHSDDLSLFYKEFLDKNFGIHFKYQREWYRRNFMLLWYGLQVDLERLLRRLTVKKINR